MLLTTRQVAVQRLSVPLTCFSTTQIRKHTITFKRCSMPPLFPKTIKCLSRPAYSMSISPVPRAIVPNSALVHSSSTTSHNPPLHVMRLHPLTRLQGRPLLPRLHSRPSSASVWNNSSLKYSTSTRPSPKPPVFRLANTATSETYAEDKCVVTLLTLDHDEAVGLDPGLQPIVQFLRFLF